jgi:hypothetical protein
MSAYQADPNTLPVRVQTLRTRNAQRWATLRQSTDPVLYSDFFIDDPAEGLTR